MPFEIPPLKQSVAPRVARRWRELRVCEHCGRTFAPAGAEERCPECRARWGRPTKRVVSAAELVAFENGGRKSELSKHRRMAAAGNRLAARTPDGPVLYCADCGRAFLAKRANARFCPGCKRRRFLAQARESMRKLYARRKVSSEA